MARPLRIQERDLHYHVISRCNNGAYHFETNEDFSLYLDLIRQVKLRHGFRLFNYVMMNSHVHLFLQPSERFSLQKTMQMINSRYAWHYNQRKERKGHFWLDRYKSIPVDSDKHALDLMRYIDRNPVRAGMVIKPREWLWGGHLFYAEGKSNTLLEPHPSYLALGLENESRKASYKGYVDMIIPGEDQRRSDLSDAVYIGSSGFGRRLGFL
ncbi:MAG: transposase [Deltaproteobacteria bacterium]|nr:transposase [Deltaproteobacteria bacterium]